MSAPERTAGWFVTVEGPEGAGKTTQAAFLRDRAAEARVPVVLTREPGGTRLGEHIRELVLDPAAEHDPRTDALLFNAARARLVDAVIRPSLAAGRLVIATRFADSTLAYQGFGAGVPLSELRALEAVATGGLRPNLTLLLDLPPEAGLDRKGSDERTRFETGFDLEFHRRVRAGFLELAASEPERFRVIDAASPAETVREAIVTAVAALPGLEAIGAPAAGRS